MDDRTEKLIWEHFSAIKADVSDGKFDRIGERLDWIRIHWLRDSLGEPVGDTDELKQCSPEELQTIVEQLRDRVHRRDLKEQAQENAIRDRLSYYCEIQSNYENGLKQVQGMDAIHRISVLNTMLGRSPSDRASLETQSQVELDSMIAELIAELRDRRK